MSDEMLAWLLTCGVFLVLAAWVPFMELLKRLFVRAAPNASTATRGFNVRRGT
jgi:hypothetical protein